MTSTHWIIIMAITLGAGIYLSGKVRRAPPTPTILLDGDSSVHGGYGDGSGALARYSPNPAQLFAQYCGHLMVDTTINGMQLAESLAGGAVASAVPGIGEVTSTASLADRIDAAPGARFVYLGCWMVDVLFYGKSTADMIALVDQAVQVCLQRGRTPILRTSNNFVENGVMTSAHLARLADGNAAIAAYADANGIPLVDVEGVAFGGAIDICSDGIHPTADYHDRIAQAVAARFIQITS